VTKSRLPEIRARRFDGTKDARSLAGNLLTDTQQQAFQRIATVLEYRTGNCPVFAEGEDAHFIFLIASGVVRISRHSDSGKRQVLALMLPGDLFGLPDEGIYVNSADVTCPTTLFRVPWQKLTTLMLRDPAFQHNLLNRVAYDLREAQRRIMILGLQNTYQRLATLLLDFTMHDEFFDMNRGMLNLPLSRFDMADYLGTTPETITRSFGRLERVGLIRRVTHRAIRIQNLDALRLLQVGKRRNAVQLGGSHSLAISGPRVLPETLRAGLPVKEPGRSRP